MIEAEHATRLGFCAAFRRDDRAAVEQAVLRMRALGARHLRVGLPASEMADDCWNGWLLARLSSELDVLPSLHVPCSEDGLACLERFVGAHGQYFSAFELLDMDTDAKTAAGFLRDLSASALKNDVVLGLAAVGYMQRLRALGQLGALDHVAAVGFDAAVAFETATLHEMLRAVGRVLRETNSRAGLWITQIGVSTRLHEIARQADVFLQAVSSCADRVYWRALADDAESDPRGEDANYGLYDSAGEPKFLGGLLAGGLAGIERVMAQTRKKTVSVTGVRPVLVTGGAGFIGANLADRLASDGHHVVIYDALARAGVERNLHWLARRHPSRISFVLGDLRDEKSLSDTAANASAVFHLAGQVAVTTSMVSPLMDFDVNTRGTLALLEALRRRNPQAPFVFASTNKVYGNLADIALVREGDAYVPQIPEVRARGIGEARALCFHTPYGCSKGAADQYVLDYAHSFGLRTAVLRMSCIYGERQLGTEDQGWVAHFLLRAIAGQPLTIYGDGRQVRDILYVGDAVDAYMSAWANIDTITGRAYNLGGGPANAISLLQLVEYIETLLGRRIDVEFSAWRPGDQRYFVADTTAIRRDLSLDNPRDWRSGLVRLAEHFGAGVKPVQVTEAAL